MILVKDNRIKILGFVFLFLLATGVVHGAAHNASGGYVTEINVIAKGVSSNWYGLHGQASFSQSAQNVSSVNISAGDVHQTDINFQLPCTPASGVTGYIYFARGNGVSNLVAGNLTQLDSFLPNSSTGDNTTGLFMALTNYSLSTGTVNDVPTAYPYVNNRSQQADFRQGYFHADEGPVFAAVIDADTVGYDGSTYDYQLVLAMINDTGEYNIFTDLTYTCEEQEEVVPDLEPSPIFISRGPSTAPSAPSAPAAPAAPAAQAPSVPAAGPAASATPTTPPVGVSVSTTPGSPMLDVAQVGFTLSNPSDTPIANARVNYEMVPGNFRAIDMYPASRFGWTSNAFSAFSLSPISAMQVINSRTKGTVYNGPLGPNTKQQIGLSVVVPVTDQNSIAMKLDTYMDNELTSTQEQNIEVVRAAYTYQAFIEPTQGTYDLVIAIDNLNQPARDVSVEFNINEGASSVFADVLGPYSLKPNEMAVVAQQFNLDKSLMGRAFTINVAFSDANGVVGVVQKSLTT